MTHGNEIDVEREKAAENAFKKVLIAYNRRQQISEEEMAEVQSYSDVIDCDRYRKWQEEALGVTQGFDQRFQFIYYNSIRRDKEVDVEREKAGEKAWKRVLLAHNRRQQISEEEMAEVHSHSDVIDVMKYLKWREEVWGVTHGIELEYGRLQFRFAILPNHYQVACLFTNDFTSQMVLVNGKYPQEDTEPFMQFQGEEGVGFPTHLLPDGIKEPCVVHTRRLTINASFGPWTKSNPRPWPSIMIDMTRGTEGINSLFARRDFYLSAATQVNVWIGLHYFKNTDAWWMGIARRRFDMLDECTNSCAWFWMYRLPGIEYAEEYININIPCSKKWNIPTEFLTFPDPVTSLPYAVPHSFMIEVEKYRERLLNPTEDGPM